MNFYVILDYVLENNDESKNLKGEIRTTVNLVTNRT